ncbi:MAG TPA: sigma-70 family RNA polymerase sigma factor [Candidatus Limnocylindrales bacterium]|nr:sigma-70 family RNA polymerase sigma factor [Candidatus Limnocylindrales bacterium]
MGAGRPTASYADRDPATRRSFINDPGPTQPDRSDDLAGDQRTVEAVLAGDRDAFRRLVERESAPVVRACHRILGDLHEAEDAAQEAFVTAYRSLAGWRGEGSFGAWLTRIAVRIALRQAGRRKTVAWRDPFGHERSETVNPIDAAMDQASMDATARMDPSSLAVRAERATDVRAAVASLPEPYREVVTLRFFGEMTLEEISRETDRPLNTVKTHLYRGLTRLRDTMGEEVGR